MDIFLYVCPECHSWQGLTDLQITAKKVANTLNNWTTLSSPASQDIIVACPSGCGLMTQVQPEDKLIVGKERRKP